MKKFSREVVYVNQCTGKMSLHAVNSFERIMEKNKEKKMKNLKKQSK